MSTSSLSLEGYEFELKGFCSLKGKTTVIVSVSGNGSSAMALTGWVLGKSPGGQDDEFSVVSCEKRRGNAPWVAAMAEDTTYELIGDAGISGVLIEERVGCAAEDPAFEFRLTFECEVDPLSLRVAYISEDDVFVSPDTLPLEPPEQFWLTPAEKSFCLYFVVSDGYKPEPCKANVSITKRGVFLSREKGSFSVAGEQLPAVMSVKTDIVGSVKVTASVPLKNFQASGDAVEAAACDCFELCETLAYTNDIEAPGMRDISISPDRKSFDMTLLNSRCGKSVYRLDGKYIIDCKRCC